MDEPHDNRIMALVHACVDMGAAERSGFLDRECRGDHELRDEVELLLAESGAKTGVHPSTQRRAKALPEHYRLIELIGAGGMAEVYLAEDTRLHRKVAIKFLNDSRSDDPEKMRRFTQEARSASALNHPNIITIHDVGESDGMQYIVSEYVDGETLATRLTRGKLVMSEGVGLAVQIASALDASHQAGIIHRDLKPENIMLRRDGGLKVVDFGLAKGSAIFGQHGETLEVVTTSPGMILGTPRYMSPEQTRGLPLDGRSDIFSFGIILFEMVTGRTPFPGTTAADTIAAILSREPREIADLIEDPPAKLVNIIGRCLQKNREDRYRSMSAVVADLQDLSMDVVTSAYGRHTTQAHELPRSSRKLHWLSVITAGILVAGIVGWALYGRGRSALLTNGALRNVTITSWSTFSAENVTAASFSPDTRMIAFGSTRSGTGEIWAKPTAGGEVIQVTKDGFYNQYPVWSPDGQEIAFLSRRGQDLGIWRVSFTGGQETQIVGGLSGLARPLRWASDGRIFFQNNSQIYTVSAGSAERRQAVDLGGIDPRAVALSRDGTAIAISVKEGDEWKLKYRRLSDLEFTDIARSKDQIDTIVFHPNGTSLFYSGGVDGTQQVFETTIAGDQPVQVSSGSTDVALQDVSVDGDKILCGSINETSDLWLVNVEGNAQVVANDVTEEFWPDISPDGRSVAYQVMPQADRPFSGAIVVKQLDSGTAQVVAQQGFAPVWSPDGKWIAYMRRSEIGVAIWKVRPSGADATRLADGPIIAPGYYNTPYLLTTVSSIAWSPDGSWLAASVKVNKNGEVFLAATDRFSDGRQLTAGDAGAMASCPIWLSDGTGIIYHSDSGGQNRIFSLGLVSPAGGPARTFFTSKDPFEIVGNGEKRTVLIAQNVDAGTTSPTPSETRVYSISIDSGASKLVTSLKSAYLANIHLSRDGRMLAYVTRAENVTELWAVPVGGGTPKRLLSDNDPKVLISSLTWSPDGKSVIFGKQTRTNVLSMLTN